MVLNHYNLQTLGRAKNDFYPELTDNPWISPNIIIIVMKLIKYFYGALHWSKNICTDSRPSWVIQRKLEIQFLISRNIKYRGRGRCISIDICYGDIENFDSTFHVFAATIRLCFQLLVQFLYLPLKSKFSDKSDLRFLTSFFKNNLHHQRHLKISITLILQPFNEI